MQPNSLVDKHIATENDRRRKYRVCNTRYVLIYPLIFPTNEQNIEKSGKEPGYCKKVNGKEGLN